MTKQAIIIDVVAFLAYLVAANPAITGIPVHEWFSLGAFVVLFVHLAMHFDWIVKTVRNIVKKPSFVRVGNLVLDILLLITLTVCVVSGILVSGTVLPALGLYADGYYFWDPLHAVSAKILLALLVVHIVSHWKMAVTFIKNKRGSGKRDDK